MNENAGSAIMNGVINWLSGDDEWLKNRDYKEMEMVADCLMFMQEYLTLAITEASIQMGIVAQKEGVTPRITKN